MYLTIIAALANNNVIGLKNRLVWHMPADLKFFKETTMGHTLIMGRKTFQSLGKPLPGRKTIVITRQEDFDAAGCQTVRSLEEAVKYVQNEEEAFIAGGAEIYKQAINSDHVKKIILTRIFADFEGDAYFPEIDQEQWELVKKAKQKPDIKNPHPYAFMEYKKK